MVAGNALALSVRVSPGGAGISAGEVELLFPSEVFEVLAVQPGGMLGPDPFVGFQEIDNEKGFVRLALARAGPTEAPSPQGDFAVLTLRAKDGAAAGTYSLELSVGLADADFEDVALASVQGATVTVLAP